MTIFDFLTMIGGLSLFLFGMATMSSALEKRAGNSLRTLLKKLTKTPLTGLLTGVFVTTLLQSSSATTVMIVGFVNAGLITLSQAVFVIMGANIGTTVTAWILSLAGIKGENFFLQLLKPSSFTPILAFIGIIFYLFGKNEKKKESATILMGFSILMYGMDTMSGALEGLKEVPAFTGIFTLFENPLLGVLAGAVLTAVIQSSSASVGILQALAATEQIRYSSVIPIIMGQNIGTCVTALLSAVGANKNAKRAALVHLAFNIIGSTVLLSAYAITKAVFHPMVLSETATLSGIAACHSAFNILSTLILAPSAPLLEKIVFFLIPRSQDSGKFSKPEQRLFS